VSQDRFTRRAIQTVAENRIRQAIEEGQLDDLPGLGKPIPDIDEPYDELWWVKRVIRREKLGRLLAERFGRDWSR
jgi:DnaJ-like protein